MGKTLRLQSKAAESGAQRSAPRGGAQPLPQAGGRWKRRGDARIQPRA